MELGLGKVAVAEADAAEALQFGRQLNQPGVVAHSLAVLARGAALHGDIAESPAAPRKPWNTPYPTASILPSAPPSSRTPKSTSASAAPAPRWNGSNH